MRIIKVFAVAAILLASAAGALMAKEKLGAQSPSVAVGPQYGATHVYIAPGDVDRFVASLVATFGGTKSQPAVLKITPTPSETIFQAVLTPVGTFSVLGFKTPIPYPFGTERAGYLVTDLDAAIRSAKAHDADIVVAPFNDPIGRDVIIVWPGGVHMQFYVHTTAANYAKLQTVPENRVYVSAERVSEFVRDFVAFSRGKVVSDDGHAPGIEIGRPNDTYRRVRINSNFGKVTVLATDGHLPFPYGREMTGYEVADLADTLTKAKASGVTVLVEPYNAAQRRAAIVEFPGGYIAEIHASDSK
jgi:predicted enzyme related to lactoylglutathione lyase